MKEEAHDIITSSSGMCYKCDQPGHTMRGCLVLEVDNKEVKDQEGKRGTRSVPAVAEEKRFSRR